MKKKIVFTGGGTAGHVTPNIALFPFLEKEGYDAFYIGSYQGIEKRLIEDFDIPYYGISTGKFRRYFDLKNLSDPFRVIKGYSQAVKILKELKPDIVFSKGGFVSVPVVLAAKGKKVLLLSDHAVFLQVSGKILQRMAGDQGNIDGNGVAVAGGEQVHDFVHAHIFADQIIPGLNLLPITQKIGIILKDRPVVDQALFFQRIGHLRQTGAGSDGKFYLRGIGRIHRGKKAAVNPIPPSHHHAEHYHTHTQKQGYRPQNMP